MTDPIQQSAASGYLEKFGTGIKKFIKLEAAAGILLMLAMLAAMLIKNSSLADFYESFLMLEGEIRIGGLSVEKALVLWVNDLWMAIFFFLVGMEIKHELQHGYLSDTSQLILPGIAAIGGMLVPALIYVAFNAGDPAAITGWAIPTATDIAFALGVLSLLGPRIPISLRIFLMTLAILDDICGIVIIAIFYTSNLSMISLGLAAVGIGVLFTLNRLNVRHAGAYIIVGIVLWTCVLKSGVHATLAGVVTAFAIPGNTEEGEKESMLNSLVHALHPWVAFAVLPMFAFVNTGINFRSIDIFALFSGIPLGIAAGLFFGKQIGVFSFSLLAIKLKLAAMPPGVTYKQLYGIALLCGIGFTMSLFIGGLAFQESGIGYARTDRFGILIGSLLSGVLGYLVLRFSSSSPQQQQE